MGCNCGKAKQVFKNLVKPGATPQPVQLTQPRPPLVTRAERIRLRGLRIAARNAAILAAQAKKNLGN